MSRVLVIDDDSMILRMAGFILKKGGHEAVTAASGAEGLEILKRELPDMVFVDNEMPDMNGMELLQAIGSDSSLSAVKVCLMTGTLTNEIQAQAQALGASACIGKPLNATELLDAVG